MTDIQNRGGCALQSTRSLPPSPLHALLCPQPRSATEKVTATAIWRLHPCHIHNRTNANHTVIPCLMCETQYYLSSLLYPQNKKKLDRDIDLENLNGPGSVRDRSRDRSKQSANKGKEGGDGKEGRKGMEEEEKERSG